MGAGKSSVVAHLAAELNIAACDIDQLIEKAAGTSIARIFETQGEETFRDLETTQLIQVTQGAPCLVSCGGGIVGRKQNRQHMHNNGFVIYLRVDIDEAIKRAGADPARPLFSDIQAARHLAAQREPLYCEAAHTIIDTTALSLEQVSNQACESLCAAGVLKQ